MKVKIKRKKHFKISYFIILITIILLFIGTSYSLLSTTLYINGNIDGNFDYSLVPVKKSDGNYSSNTGFTVILFWIFGNVDIFDFDSDVSEKGMLTTQIKNGDKSLSTNTKNTTFSFTLKNDSPFRLTDGSIEVEVPSTSQYMSTNGSPSIGSTTLEANGTTTVSVPLTFNARNNVPAGSYITYIIKYKFNSLTISYRYKILVTQ